MNVTIVEERPWDKHDKMRALRKLREDIGENAFRSAVAKVQAIDMYENYYYRGKKVCLSDIHMVVNMSLRNLGCPEVSYATVQQLLQDYEINRD